MSLQAENIIRKYVLTTWSENNYIFAHGIVHWVYNDMYTQCTIPCENIVVF